MTVQTFTRPTTHPGGCDCGRGHECDGHVGVCEPCVEEGLARPRFFAGELLTEEDLGAGVDYVVAKNRLLRRHLFGAGVVCGLWVRCHPCGEGRVTVEPGYALDCCGDDIVVSCQKELNILKMIRDLRTKLRGGYDCGDPCDDGTSNNGNQNQQDANRGVNAANNQGEEEEEDPGRSYCLYVRYCETPTDPVSPYATDDPCTHSACEASRIREGYRFELRCPPEEEEPDNVLQRILCCLGDLDSAEDAARIAMALHALAARMRTAMRDVEAEVSYSPQAHEALERSLRAIEERKPTPGEAEYRGFIDDLLTCAVAVARYDALDEGKRKEPRGKVKDIGHKINTAKTAINRAVKLHKEVAPDMWDSELLNATVDAVERWTKNTVRSKDPLGEEFKLFLGGLVWSQPAQVTWTNLLSRLRQWLLNRLDKVTHPADCGLLDEVRTAVARTSGSVTQELLSSTAETLVSAYVRYLVDCICAAINPPCPPCDDPAVLLACLTVKDCEVVDICNLKRTYVQAPASWRYWLPPLHWLGRLLEVFCCELPLDVCKPERESAGPETPPKYSLKGGLAAPRVGTECEALIRTLTSFADRFLLIPRSAIRPVVNIAKDFWRIARERGSIPPIPLPEKLMSPDAAGIVQQVVERPEEKIPVSKAKPKKRKSGAATRKKTRKKTPREGK